jgi:NTP pyrophosphatase (non-canonical NTP hydrolase)
METQTGANLSAEAIVCTAADELRGTMDSATHKKVVLGLLFLKYVSDEFEERQAGADQRAALQESFEYRHEGDFVVPAEARWSTIMDHASQPTIGQTIENAMRALERANESLKDRLPNLFQGPGVGQASLGQFIDALSKIELGTRAARTKDILGRIHEGLLYQLSNAVGSALGEKSIHGSVAKLLSELRGPSNEDHGEDNSNLGHLTRRIIAFRDARNWSQFHTAKDNALSIQIETAEFAELVRWTPEDQIDRTAAGDELADVLYWVLLAAHDLNVNLSAAFDRKMSENGAKYPVELSRGRSVKYDKF